LVTLWKTSLFFPLSSFSFVSTLWSYFLFCLIRLPFCSLPTWLDGFSLLRVFLFLLRQPAYSHW
jgi:hypothetical protein